jgi:hypothetical protein
MYEPLAQTTRSCDAGLPDSNGFAPTLEMPEIAEAMLLASPLA